MTTSFFCLRSLQLPFFFLGLLTFSCVSAQSPRSLVLLEFAATGAMPVGEFGSKKYMASGFYYENQHGAAKAGYGYGVTLGVKIKRNLSVVLNARDRYFSQSSQPFMDTMEAAHPGGTFTAETPAWKVKSFLLGIRYTQTVGQKKLIYARAQVLAGVSDAEKPGYSLAGTYQNGGFTSWQMAHNLKRGFSYEISMGVAYPVLPWMTVLTDIAFFDGGVLRQHQFWRFLSRTPGYPSNQELVYYKERYKLTAISVNVGVGFHL